MQQLKSLANEVSNDATDDIPTLEDTLATLDDEPSEDLPRAKRSPLYPTYLPQQIYQYPTSPYLIYTVLPGDSKIVQTPQKKSIQEQQSLLYQPQYFYQGVPNLKSGRQFPALPIQPTYFNQPSYVVPYVPPGQAVRSDSEEPITDAPQTTSETENLSNFPVVSPGAVVAQVALPEDAFPVFPYDPEQDKPAAVQYWKVIRKWRHAWLRNVIYECPFGPHYRKRIFL